MKTSSLKNKKIDHIFIGGWLDPKPLDCCRLIQCGLNQCAVEQKPRWYFTFTAVCCTFLQQIDLIYITIHWAAPWTTNRRILDDFHQLKIPSFSLLERLMIRIYACKFFRKNSTTQPSSLLVVLWTHISMLFFLMVSKQSFQVMLIHNNLFASDPTIGPGQIALFFFVP